MRAPASLEAIIRPAVEGLGYELVGAELHRQRGHSLVRVYIDQADGIAVEDCQAVSEQLSAVLDVEDPIKGHYTLEVSSPGFDRPLFDKPHFERFVGQKARVRLALPVDGRRKFSGVLQGMEGEDVVMECEGEIIRLPFDAIEQARLVPEY